MPWWKFWQPETEAEQQLRFKRERAALQQQESIKALERGEIPPIAKERILKHVQSQHQCFSSDLSVREFLLTREVGVEPISQVMGTCMYRVGYFGSTWSWGYSGEMYELTQSVVKARTQALERMRQEAALLGATGVIGVRFTAHKPDIGCRTSSFTAFGTAVRLPGYPPGAPPFTSDLNGQEFWQLYKAGYRPHGVAIGACSYYVQSNYYTMMQTSSWANQEVAQYTTAFNDARQRSVERMYQVVDDLQAEGIVGVQFDVDIEEIERERNETRYKDMIIHVVAMGTAVSGGHEVTQPAPLLCINLKKGSEEALVNLAVPTIVGKDGE